MRSVVRLVRGSLFALAGAVLLMPAAPQVVVAAASAQETTPAAPAPGQPIKVGTPNNDNPQPWTVNCTSQGVNADLVCTMTQVLVQGDTGQRLVGASVFRPDASGAAVMRINLPHGIRLPDGVDVWIDANPATKHVIGIADQNGSYADVPLDGNTLVSLQGGNVLQIGVTTGAGERIEFQLSLKGFTAAFAKL
jgi:invasion protein IalB